jgi:hypothetical protein
MRLHALQRMDELSTTLEVHRSLLRQQRALNLTPRPEKVLHPAPRLRKISTKVAGTVLAHRETRRSLCESNVDDTALVHAALDVITLTVLGDLHGAFFGAEVVLVVREGEIVEVIGGPELGGIGLRVDDLCVELCGGADAEDVAEDDLHETELAIVGSHVEGLRLDVGRVHDLPAEVVLSELGVGHILGLLRDGLDGFGAILALCDADAGKGDVLVKCAGVICEYVVIWRGRWDDDSVVVEDHVRLQCCGQFVLPRRTYAFFAQLNMIADLLSFVFILRVVLSLAVKKSRGPCTVELPFVERMTGDAQPLTLNSTLIGAVQMKYFRLRRNI